MNLCTEQKQTHRQKQMYVYQRREKEQGGTDFKEYEINEG